MVGLVHVSGSFPEPAPAHASLRSAESLAALYRVLGDHDLVHRLCSNFSSWDQLASVDYGSLVNLLGPRAASFHLPATPPQEPDLPDGVELITRYSMSYPPELREVSSPPIVLYTRGELPDGPAVAIAGAEHPSPQGVEIARSAALAAVAQRLPVVVLLTDGVGAVALRTVVAAAGHAVVVVPHGLDQLSKYDTLLREALDLGGCVVTEVPAGIRVSEVYTLTAARIVVALSRAVVLAEVGRHISAGAAMARAAVGAGRFLVVPTPQQHYVPESALGLRVLTETRSFSPTWYGSSPRIDSRVENGLSPADAVVSSQNEIAHAISVACHQD